MDVFVLQGHDTARGALDALLQFLDPVGLHLDDAVQVGDLLVPAVDVLLLLGNGLGQCLQAVRLLAVLDQEAGDLLLCVLGPRLHAAHEVVADVVLCHIKAPVEGSCNVAVLAQSLDDFGDLVECFALLLLRCHVQSSLLCALCSIWSSSS